MLEKNLNRKFFFLKKGKKRNSREIENVLTDIKRVKRRTRKR